MLTSTEPVLPHEILFILYIAVYWPYIAIRAARKGWPADRPVPSRSRIMVSAIVVMAVLGSLGLVTAYASRMNLFPAWRPDLGEVLGGVGLLILAVGARGALLE